MGSFVGQPENPEETEAVTPADEEPESPSIRDDVQALLDSGQQVSPDIPPTDESVSPQTPEAPADSPPVETYKLGEYEIPADQVDDVVGLIQWASSLNDEQAAAALQAAQDPSQFVFQQDPDDSTQYVEPDDTEAEYQYEEVPESIVKMRQTDPAVAEAMEEMWYSMQEERAELEQELTEQQQRFQLLEATTGEDLATRQQAETLIAEEQAAARFVEQYGEMDDTAYQTLVTTAGQLNVVPGLVQQYGMEEGFYRALETAMYANPELREQTLQQQVQQQVAQAQTNVRKDNASALNTPQAGTNIPAQSADNLPSSEKRKAMTRDIEAMLGQG